MNLFRCRIRCGALEGGLNCRTNTVRHDFPRIVGEVRVSLCRSSRFVSEQLADQEEGISMPAGDARHRMPKIVQANVLQLRVVPDRIP